MQRLSPRINFLMSSMTAEVRSFVETCLVIKLRSAAVDGLQKKCQCTAEEAEQLVFFIERNNNPEANKIQKSTISYSKLIKKSNKILVPHNKLKNINKFKKRENLGRVGQMNMDIGNEINKLDVSHLNKVEITQITDDLVTIHDAIEKAKADSTDKEHLIEFNVAAYCKGLDDEYKQRKRELAIKNNNNNNNNNLNNDNEQKDDIINNKNKKKNKKKHTYNSKSHKVNSKYAALIKCQNDQYDILSNLKEYEKKAIDIGKQLHLFDQHQNCHQEMAWKGLFDNTQQVTFKGSEMYNRIKKLLKNIKDIRTTVNNNIIQLNNSTNETIWRKEGRLRSKKTMKERIKSYEHKLTKKRNNYKKKGNSVSGKKRRRDDLSDDDTDNNEPAKKKPKQMSIFDYVHK